MGVKINTPTTAFSGKVTVAAAGTRVQLGFNSCQSITITALSTNVGVVYVGGANVASVNGHQLQPNGSTGGDITSVGAFWIDAANSGDGVTYLATA